MHRADVLRPGEVVTARIHPTIPFAGIVHLWQGVNFEAPDELAVESMHMRSLRPKRDSMKRPHWVLSILSKALGAIHCYAFWR
mmetsp:Transcript_5942/g.14716  ORF Transcript_5942/g.14716 Transcript_5942/m.14716 type:complete len:83 (-) Transcript_5942:162-410(-)